jgi:flagellar biosynthesis protein FlhF
MAIEKFSGATLQQVVETIRKRWGPDAAILHVVKRKGPRRLFRPAQEWVEVTAKQPEAKESSFPSGNIAAAAPLLKRVYSTSVQEAPETASAPTVQVPARSPSTEGRGLRHPLLDFMIEKGLSENFAAELLVDWKLKNPSLDLSLCMADLDRRLPRVEWRDLFPMHEGRCTLLFGLPGSGKTLLLIKLAAQMRLMHEVDVLLVSADMSRPGPPQELELYSEILNIPVTHIFNLSELQAIAAQVSPKTHILVDWNGVSPYTPESWEALENLKKYHSRSQIVLTASLASDLRNWELHQDRLKALPLVALALTQADLEHRFGKVWEAVRGTNLPVAFFSTGKNVPGDFYEAKGFPFARHFFHGCPASSQKVGT